MDATEVMSRIHSHYAGAEPDLPNGFAEHVPMGADAMLSMGIEPAAVLAWAHRHTPTPASPTSPAHEMRATIAAELADEPWPEVLHRRLVTLVPRLDAHLFHGLIRTAHAVRSITRHDDRAARHELAAGLAAWTVWAGDAGREVVPSTSPDPLAAVHDAARRGAAAFVASPSIFNLHALTAPMAYRLIDDHLEGGLSSHNHAVAAAVFATTHRRHPSPTARATDRDVPGPEALATLALRWDAHPAKLVEAALRGHARSGDGVFLDAVATMMS